MKNVERISEKAVISGSVVELYKYQKSYLKGGECINRNGRAGGAQELTGEEKAANREKVLSRCRKQVRRLVNANVGQYGDCLTSKFITLTYRYHETSFKNANDDFKKFIKRLNYYVFKVKQSNLKYVQVSELTKAGRVHFHVVIFNLPYISNQKLADIWAKGFVKINKIDDVDNIGAYVCKYMTKDVIGKVGLKAYTSSRGLFKPVEITEKKEVEKLRGFLPSEKITFQSQFDSDYLGQISYTQYNINRKQNKR